MKKYSYRNKVVLLLLCVLVFFCAYPVQAVSAVDSTLTEEEAQQNTTQINAAKQRVYEDAGLLTAEQVQELEQLYAESAPRANADIILVTTNSLNGKSEQVYLEDFQDALFFNEGALATNAVLMLIEMENRSVTIQGYGDCEFWLNNDRIEYVLDDVYSYLSVGDYYGAAQILAEEVVYYMNDDTGVSTTYQPGQDYGESASGHPSYYEGARTAGIGEVLLDNMVRCGFFAVILATIVCVCINSSAKTKVTVQSQTYLDSKQSQIIVSRDDFLRTTVSKTKKPSSSSSGGGGYRSSGGGGRSSGGRSHSGGSRRF